MCGAKGHQIDIVFQGGSFCIETESTCTEYFNLLEGSKTIFFRTSDAWEILCQWNMLFANFSKVELFRRS